MSPYDLLLLLLGGLTGLALGALGSGGSILALPAFVYAAGLPVKSAVATSLAVVGMTSLIGAVLAQRRCKTFGCPGQEVDARIAGLFMLGGLVGAFTGARLSHLLPDSVQMLLFAAAIGTAAIGMLRRRNAGIVRKKPAAPRPTPALPFWFAIPLLGLGVGLLTGTVGVGGGFLIVPALTLLANVPVKRAAATSLWIIAANAGTGMLGHLGSVPIAWEPAGLFMGASLLGMIAGQSVARIARPQKLQAAFAVFLLLVGGFTLARTLTSKSALVPPSAAPAGQPIRAADRR